MVGLQSRTSKTPAEAAPEQVIGFDAFARTGSTPPPCQRQCARHTPCTAAVSTQTEQTARNQPGTSSTASRAQGAPCSLFLIRHSGLRGFGQSDPDPISDIGYPISNRVAVRVRGVRGTSPPIETHLIPTSWVVPARLLAHPKTPSSGGSVPGAPPGQFSPHQRPKTTQRPRHRGEYVPTAPIRTADGPYSYRPVIKYGVRRGRTERLAVGSEQHLRVKRGPSPKTRLASIHTHRLQAPHTMILSPASTLPADIL
jgi:hypothetical protein